MEQIKYPQKAIITVGKADGNKEIHIGHLLGGLINADIFARFLKNRIGNENVLLFSGTECYGTSIIESYLKSKEKFSSIDEYVYITHCKQKNILDQFQISFNDYFCASNNEILKGNHTLLCQRFIDYLIRNKDLIKTNEEILIDSENGNFLNYRQVKYINKSENDKKIEGTKYSVENLENMQSTISNKKPELVHVENYFINLEKRKEELYNLHLAKYTKIEKYTKNIFPEFILSFSNKDKVKILELSNKYNCTINEKKNTFNVVFENGEDLNEMKALMENLKIEYTYRGFIDKCRLTSDTKWGIDVKINEEEKKLWVWIDSLIAPISYTIDYLEKSNENPKKWNEWWGGKDSQVYHFMAEDNVFFYTVIENFLIQSWNEQNKQKINYPQYYLSHMRTLFNGKYTGTFPTGELLLNKYTTEQLRYSIASMGNKNSSFNPKKILDSSIEEDDITMKYNSIFKKIKTLSKYVLSKMVEEEKEYIANEKALEFGCNIFLEYEKKMINMNFSSVIDLIEENLKQILQDKENIVYNTKMILIMLNPFLPEFTEKIYTYLYPDTDLQQKYDVTNPNIRINCTKKIERQYEEI